MEGIKGNPTEAEDEEKLCLVCNDISSGKHYGAVTCEGCKGFFRRIICHNNENSYQCVNNDNPNQCPITSDGTRRKCCKSCRFKKCLAIGMKPELCIKIEPTQSRPHRGSDPETGSEALFESEEQMLSMKQEVIRAFLQIMTFKPLSDPSPSLTGKRSPEYFNIYLNEMKIHLTTKVRTFVSNVEVFRELDQTIQSRLISQSIPELLILMFIYDHERFKTFIVYKDLYFGDNELDITFRSLIAIMNALKCELTSGTSVTGFDPILSLISALNLLVIIESHRFESSEDSFDKIQVQLTKERVLMAFELMDESKGAKVSQILYHLRAINALFIKRRIFINI